MKCLLVCSMLFIVVFGGGGCPDRQGFDPNSMGGCRLGSQDIVDQVLELCDANGDAMLSIDEVKDCEVCNINI